MKTLFLFLILSVSASLSYSQKEKDSLIAIMSTDTVMAYQGSAPNYYDTSVLIKYTGTAKSLFNELVSLHALDPDAVERTPKTIYIPQTNSPYWVYGSYSVYGNFQQGEEYALVEIWFSAYNRPGNYKMTSAAGVYQKIVNRLLGK